MLIIESSLPSPILYTLWKVEPRSHFKSRLSFIVRVNVVLNRTVFFGDSDWRFDNLCDSHLQSQSEFYHVISWNYTHNTINWRDTTHFDCEDDYRTGCRIVSHCQQQQQRSSRRSNWNYFCIPCGTILGVFVCIWFVGIYIIECL